MSSPTLRDSITRQRRELHQQLREPLGRIARACVSVWPDRERLNQTLSQALPGLRACTYLYALDAQFVQLSDNIAAAGSEPRDYGRDRSQRPYVREVGPETDFLLSEAYISLRARRPSLTAIQRVSDAEGRLLGYVGADFDLRNLPLTRELYEEPRQWQQIKGDPSIRGSVFQQSRSESEMDRQIETVLGVVEELMSAHGIYHVMLHFSSSRGVFWLLDDPYRYRLLDIESLADPDLCLAYPCHAYPPGAVVPQAQIWPILDSFRQLRFNDETFYLRSGTLNLFNGIVGLTFSCDGSHYIPWEEFLDSYQSFLT